VPAGIAQDALGYLVEGGPQNLGQLAAFLSDTVLRTGEGFLAPVPMPEVGVRAGASLPAPDGRPRVGVIYYRAHELSGNTAFIDDLVPSIGALSRATPRGAVKPVRPCRSLHAHSTSASSAGWRTN